MEWQTPDLTVGIPTFNNPLGVATQLNTLINQIRSLGTIDKVDIFVSDNSEDSETEESLRAIDTRGINFEYHKNSSNIGYDRNVDHILTKAKGTFCWLLSDNDFIVPEALEVITAAIRKYSETSHIIIDTDLGATTAAFYSTYEQLVEAYDNRLSGGLVSQNIFRKSLLPVDRSKYYGNLWFHFSLLLETCAKKPVVLLPNLFLPDDDWCRWARDGMTFVTFTSLFSIIKSLGQYGYSARFCAVQENAFRKDFPRQLVTGKIYGLRAKREYFRTIDAALRPDSLKILYCYILLVTPAFVFRFLKYLKSLWKRSS